MTDRELKLIAGALLHDIGKVLFRCGDGRQHSISGAEYLSKDAGVNDEDILNIVRYHHRKELHKAKIAQDDLAYIVYIADNIAAASDRREEEDENYGFDVNSPLDSIFNILNGNDQRYHYKPVVLDDREGPNMPTEKPVQYDESFYNKVKADITQALKGVSDINDEYINSLVSVLEAYLSYIPSSTATHEKADISLFDHLKMTAAYSSSILQYLDEQGIHDYQCKLLKGAKDFYGEKAFALISMDVSGIQKFIYTIHSDGALRMLRARSFYLEILMEHVIDEFLTDVGLSRANLIYSGGGHCYILAGNTERVREGLGKLEEEVNVFFIKNFDVSLYIAMGMEECSANDLSNKPSGSYAKVFQQLSRKLSVKKGSRYSPAQIRVLNQKSGMNAARECKVCKTSAHVNDDGVCPLCAALGSFSTDILYKDFFTVIKAHEKANMNLSLPGDKVLIAQTEAEVRNSIENDPYFIRTYGKNRFYTGRSVSTRLWVGDYTAKGKTTEDYAEDASGIDRIAVLRGDVDNLGKAFVSGFDEKFTSLSRTATFSRQLSLFFKHYINDILENGVNDFSGKKGPRNATIVYSGGDDVFIVGSWDDVLALSIDIRNALHEYSQGTLSISAGFGIYRPKFPLSVCAREVADLEDLSKAYPSPEKPEKNAITLFGREVVFEKGGKKEESNTYPWDILEYNIIGEKLAVLKDFLAGSEERGTAFLYHLLDLLRHTEDKINLARFAYVLARLEPKDDAARKANYRAFSRKIYEWALVEKDRRQLITAIYLYVYLHREGGNE